MLIVDESLGEDILKTEDDVGDGDDAADDVDDDDAAAADDDDDRG